MGLQYDRALKLSVGGTPIVTLSGNPDQALRVRFKFTTQTTQAPNNIQVIITNAAPATSQNLMKAIGKQLTLEAGYLSNSGLIFKGDIYYAINGRESPTDTTVQIFARDGGTGYDYGVVSKSLAKGSTPKDHFDTFVQAMSKYGITAGYTPDTLTQTKYPRGVAFAGMVKDYMRTLATSNNCTWSIQNGQMQMVPINGAVPGSPYVLNSSTGLIGMPTQTPGGIMIRCLINPAINLGSGNIVQVDQKDIQLAAISPNYTGGSTDSPEAYKLPQIATDGLYKILHIETTGDTRGNPWYMDLSCIAKNGDGFIPSNLVYNYTAN